MAHWIIEDHGFGGQTYTCSECRESWNDIYSNVSMEETCPKCGALINEDETEYIEYPRTYIGHPYHNASKTLRHYEETETKLIKVSGFDMEKLIELFAAGYTLQPPKHADLNDICKLVL